jgi:hypothetical protein
VDAKHWKPHPLLHRSEPMSIHIEGHRAKWFDNPEGHFATEGQRLKDPLVWRKFAGGTKLTAAEKVSASITPHAANWMKATICLLQQKAGSMSY